MADHVRLLVRSCPVCGVAMLRFKGAWRCPQCGSTVIDVPMAEPMPTEPADRDPAPAAERDTLPG
jgi:uncharacterized Zn finger protein (UPF0148 family)